MGIYDQAYTILVEECGANELGRSDFLAVMLNEPDISEYRFQGKLGYGGKFWPNNGPTPYVTCYPEDETPTRRGMIERANKRLEELAIGGPS
jgi:hypothetical protein